VRTSTFLSKAVEMVFTSTEPVPSIPETCRRPFSITKVRSLPRLRKSSKLAPSGVPLNAEKDPGSDACS
jgi:hypothetical protein